MNADVLYTYVRQLPRAQGGSDRLIGGDGSDESYGGFGDDTLNSREGVEGNDSLDGGVHIRGDRKVSDATEQSLVGFP